MTGAFEDAVYGGAAHGEHLHQFGDRVVAGGVHADGTAAAGFRYQRQRGPTASRSHINFHRTQV
jgi:hypothetical protein